MCTVSWLRQPGGYDLFCNRDEKFTRAPGAPPQERSSRGVRYLAPADGDFGGTWVAANEHGLSLCLLNGPASGSGAGDAYHSRGLLLHELAPARTVAEVARQMEETDLSRFQQFTLLALAPGSPARIVYWDGMLARMAPDNAPWGLLSSSSFDPDRVQVERQREFTRRLAVSPAPRVGLFLSFHRSHEPSRGPYSPCMHRPDAETVSFTWVSVTRSGTSMYYAAGPPCRSFAGESRTLSPGGRKEAACTVSC